jgi:ribonuclease HI
MSKKPKQKFYVVWEGIEPGIYDNWADCKKQIEGVEGAVYKSFLTMDMAEYAFERSSKQFIGKDIKESTLSKEKLEAIGKPILPSICVDGACSGSPGVSEYRGVDTETGAQFFRQGPYQEGTNNVVEFLGIVHALAFCKQRNLDLPIYSDSKNAMNWVKYKNPRTKLKPTSKNQKIFELLDRAVKWLHQNDYKNKILKWETKAWGENPADFGRK